ncbi:SDR family NAD(P)-dependent oxidoreductase [Pseudoalteromonas rubra]|uniref:SDR family NAD(P)-dependent oxidoreductase n=1 Tax=Pseudoalteromonas rubra TaxID=43658 RepID=A0A5S3UTR9_9GAMM|nr:type I polyketide synthase [Pseudoalteromonas rubra]QPB84824.1 SDR family NAD(P)-dependent oxidoreductase [Pseudoalteromonas rubra]
MSEQHYSELDIAIVGMAGRFPDADNVDALWQNIRAGRCAVQSYDDEALRRAGVSESDLSDPDYVKRGIPFDGLAQFDAEFFGYTPKEAEQLDPQQRHFLQTCWHAMAHAGLAQGELTGVYAGCGVPAYLMQNLLQGQSRDITSLLALTNGNDKDSLATRVSYELDLKGPAVTVQTACSTSLVAVHMACRALQNFECDSALAGGVWLNLTQDQGYHAPAGGSLSPSGQLSAFGEQADGILIGSGSAAVVLKRLAEAQEDGDHILAVIKGSAINNDGRDKVGYTAPSVNGQANAIMAALEFADIDPQSVGYIEAHGTGTELGDPIEIAALSQAYAGDVKQYCAIGSAKTNLGHLDAAAGVTGLIKAVQALRHQELPPSLHSQPLNSKIDFANSPFYVNTELKPWHSEGVRRAAVSSLGMGGTNAHVILEEYNQPDTEHSADSAWQVLPISASSQSALVRQTQALADTLQRSPEQFAQLAAQLQHKRSALAVRYACVAENAEQAIAQLLREPQGDKAVAPRVALMFSGQGSQYVTMAQPLLREVPVFKAAFDEVMGYFPDTLQQELHSVFSPADSEILTANQLLNQTRITQPALFVVAYAMAKCYEAHGVVISAMLGHSIGEYAAACLAGVMTLEVATKLVAARGEVLQNMAPGTMLSVMANGDAIAPYLNDALDIAALNSPTNTVIAGTREAIKALQGELKAADIAATRLHVSHAFHSHLTESVLPDFASTLEQVLSASPLQAPNVPFVSNVSGTWITAEQACSAQYWLDHIRQPVNFVAGVKVLAENADVLIEAGPGDTLQKLAKQSVSEEKVVLHSVSHARDLKAPLPPFGKTLAKLWQLGCAVDFAQLTVRPHGQLNLLPEYVFADTEYWVEPGVTASAVPVASTSAGQQGAQLYAPQWQQCVALQAVASLTGKRVLLLAADIPLVSQLSAALTQAGAELTQVWQGDTFSVIEEKTYRLNLQDGAQLSELSQAVGDFDQVVDTRFMLPQSSGTLAYNTLLPVVQWLMSLGGRPLSIVATELFNVLGDDTVSAEKASMLGLTRVAPLELASQTCQVLALTQEMANNPSNKLTGRLVADLVHGDEEIAYRGTHRFALTQIEVSAQSVAGSVPGVTLITGGLGGIGLALAKHLAGQGHTLVLQTRQQMAEPAQWAQLSEDEQQPQKLRERYQQLHALQQSGARLTVISADVTDMVQMQAALTQAQAEVGTVTQVIHAAGLPGGGLLKEISAEQAQQSAAAKVQGTQTLLQLFADTPLTRMVLCSCLASIVGAFAQSDYCGANSYLDAVAQQDHPFTVQVLNWDAWLNTGMTANISLADGLGLSHSEACQLFDAALSLDLAQVYCTSTEWSQLCAATRATEQALLARLNKPKGHARPELAVEYEAPESELEHKLVALWAEYLGFEQIGIFDSMLELGGDSLVAIQMLAKAKQMFSVELEPAAFFEDPTIDNLAFMIEEQLVAQLQTH